MRHEKKKVHETEKTNLIVQSICNIPGLECEYEPHGVGHICKASTTHSLLADHACVDQYPEDEARAELIERLDIEGSDGRIQLAPDIPLNELRPEHIQR